MTVQADPKRETSQTPGDRPVLIVVPPFQDIIRPALGASQLKANLLQHGIPAEILYMNIMFAEHINPRAYEWIGTRMGRVTLGEFVFSHALFDHAEDSIDRYIKAVLPKSTELATLKALFGGVEFHEVLGRLTQICRDFCDNEALDAVLARDPWMLGFSSSFQQNCSSLAVLKRVKAARPDIIGVMGGANCETEMGRELFDRFDTLDFVGQGECDHSFIALVKALKNGENGHGIRGILARGQKAGEGSAPLQGSDLDGLPHPDFDDYFAQLSASSLAEMISPGLVMETSRGCWWGAKQHCTFCGLNGSGMVYRSKSPERAITETKTLTSKYQVPHVEVVDNILDMGYFRSVLPELAKDDPKLNLFFETKANLSREQVEMLAKAGVRTIQPGIESLSNGALKLMRKGSSKFQNIQLLKWCGEYGIRVIWNFLFGFPGEDEGEMPQLEWECEALQHLYPPGKGGTLILDRFSPYFETPEEWGLTPVGPAEMFRHIYPFPEESLARIASVYTSPVFEKKAESPALEQLRRFCEEWLYSYPKSHLLAIPRRNATYLYDTRKCATRKLHRLSGLRRKIYDYCDRGHAERSIIQQFEGEASPEKIVEILQQFVKDRLMLEDEKKYLSLAVVARPGYRYLAHFPGGEFVQPKSAVVRQPLGQRIRRVATSPSEALKFARRRAARTKRRMDSFVLSLATNLAQDPQQV